MLHSVGQQMQYKKADTLGFELDISILIFREKRRGGLVRDDDGVGDLVNRIGLPPSYAAAGTHM